MSANEDKRGFVVRQEPDRVSHGKLRGGAVLAALGIAASIGATLLFLRADADRAHDAARGAPAPSAVTPAQAGTVETSLILATERGLALRAAQRGELDRWGWVDRDAGIARIPIERAMDMMAADGGDAGP